MARFENKQDPSPGSAIQIDQIKKLVIIAMFSDDELMEHLVLKGGNALDLIYNLSARASIDVDLSMAGDFPGGRESLLARAKIAIQSTFRDQGYVAFDIELHDRPPTLTADLADFWGGYLLEFKLISNADYKSFSADLVQLRKRALRLGQGSRFLIDISRHEYVAAKETIDFEGFQIAVYSPEMLLVEKLRALCQQTVEYGSVVKRERRGTPRARDFLDIYTLATRGGVDLSRPENHQLVRNVFAAKKVDLSLLKLLPAYREFHRMDFPAVTATIKPEIELHEFDQYFDFTLRLIEAFFRTL